MILLEDDRFIVDLNDKQKGLYLMLIALAGKTNNHIRNDIDFIKARLNLKDMSIQDIERISEIFPKFKLDNNYWRFEDFEEIHNYVLGNPKTQKGIVQNKKENKKENKDPASGLYNTKNLIKDTAEKLDPKRIDLSKINVSANGKSLSEASKHKLYNKIVRVFDIRGWKYDLIKSVFEACAVKVNKANPKDLYPYFEKSIAQYCNENAESLNAQSRKLDE